MIFLPGTDKQLKFLTDSVDLSGKNILIAGNGTIDIALSLLKLDAERVQIITDDNSSLTEMRYRLKSRDIAVKLMDYSNTDFRPGTFDIIFSQGTFSIKKRRKIYKEMVNILKPDGFLCSGEIISSVDEIPRFQMDLWESSGLSPLTSNQQIDFFKESGLQIIEHKNLSFTLKEFYENGRHKLQEFEDNSPDEEKIFYKKLLNKFSHESNSYLKLGGSRYMEFHVFLLKRQN